MAAVDFMIVSGYAELTDALTQANKKVAIYLTAPEDEECKSWCPDCVKAKGTVQDMLDDLMNSDIDYKKKLSLDEDLLFIKCFVGSREFWKDAKNPFRTDTNLRVNSIPTLMMYGCKEKRLTEEELLKEDLWKLFFSNDD